MPRFCRTHAITARDLRASRWRCDGCDAPRPAEEHACEPRLWLVTEGAFELRDRSGRHVLDPTCAIVFAPHAPYTIRHPAGPDVCISISGPLVDALAADGTHVIRLDTAAHARIVAAVHGDHEALPESLAALARDHVAPSPRLARRLVDLLRVEFAAPTPLAELTAAAGASLFHAARVFRSATGHTLHGFRRDLRLRHALAMLIDGDAPLAEIAAHAGFASQSHLTNQFRARFGTTPGRVRASRALT